MAYHRDFGRSVSTTIADAGSGAAGIRGRGRGRQPSLRLGQYQAGKSLQMADSGDNPVRLRTAVNRVQRSGALNGSPWTPPRPARATLLTILIGIAVWGCGDDAAGDTKGMIATAALSRSQSFMEPAGSSSCGTPNLRYYPSRRRPARPRSRRRVSPQGLRAMSVSFRHPH